MKNAYHLKKRTTPTYLNDQFPREIEHRRRVLRPIIRIGKERGFRCALVYDKLLINNKEYTVNDLLDIPFDISSIGTKTTDDHVMFSGRTSPYSNFFTRDKLFTLGGIVFNSN